ncbi:MAG: FAD-dependent oxidoreductase, partial [Steroidobacteraceae bacterium]|nr:FAD-dependent oxidoreductase [Steroidobacteraceae bacterium]
EGRDRVGGKILTFANVPGLPEAGGQSIGSGYGRVVDAAQRSGIVLEDQLPQVLRHPDIALVLDGQPIAKSAWKDSPRNPFPAPLRELMPWQYTPLAMAKGNPLKSVEDWFAPQNAAADVSMHQFLRAQGASEAMIDLAYDTNTSYGTSSHDISALMMAFVEAFTRAQRNLKPAVYKARGGNQRIPEGMAQRLKGGVRFNQSVTAVASDAGGVTVHTRDGGRYTAQAAICALPFATLRHLRFEPGLAGRQAEAVKSLPHQMITQVALEARKPFWESDGIAPAMWTDSPIGRVFAIYRGPTDDEVASLLVTAYGHKASYLDRLGREGAARFIVAELERIRPAAQGRLRVAAQHSWALDPFAAGDWAYFAPGTVTQFMPAMFQPHGRVHFCGEQTAVGARGMEGAMESGERAALEVALTLA